MEKIRGKVLAVNISQKKGEKKNNINCGIFIENLGLENRRSCGSRHPQKVSLFARESIEKIKSKGTRCELWRFRGKSYY